MRRLLILGLLALLVAGCGEDPRQRAARLAVQAKVGGAHTRCTQTPRIYLKYVAADDFVCVVDREGDPRCDEYLARRRGDAFVVRLRRREVDCALPLS